MIRKFWTSQVASSFKTLIYRTTQGSEIDYIINIYCTSQRRRINPLVIPHLGYSNHNQHKQWIEAENIG